MRLVEMDERGRITLPEEIRKRLRGRVFKVELVDPNTVVLRIADRGDVIKEIEGIKLAGDPRRKSGDASEAKHRYGDVKA